MITGLEPVVTASLPFPARAAVPACVLVPMCVLALLAGCAKSGSSFDEDFNNAGKPPFEGDGSGGTGGSPGSGPGDIAEEQCGNGVIDGGEECDGALLGGATCQTLGFSGGGALNCDPVTCTYDEAMCRRPPGQGGAGSGG